MYFHLWQKNKFLYNVLKVLLLIAILIFIVLFIRKGKKEIKRKYLLLKIEDVESIKSY